MGIRLFFQKLIKPSQRDIILPQPGEVIVQIDAYLRGDLSWQDVSRWACRAVVRKKHREHWDDDVEEAIYALLSLDHGPDASWAPSREELIELRNRLSRLARPQDRDDAKT